MQAIDSAAIESIGIPRVVLMDHAGLAVARQAAQQALDKTQPVLICCGTGFNGGDGLSAARHLYNLGYSPQVLLAGRLERLRDEPKIFASIAQKLGIAITECEPMRMEGLGVFFARCGLIVDALLGIGAQGPLREPHASLIRLMNGANKPIIAVDLPSGLDGNTGVVGEMTVRAHVTVTFGRIKQGCVIGEGPAHCGSIVVEPITFPRQLLGEA